MRIVTAAALALGCSCGAGERGPAPAQTRFWSDDLKMMPYVEAMTSRMVAATGRDDISVSPDGIPFVFQDDLIDPRNGKVSCGLTFGDDDGFVRYVAVDPTQPKGCNPINVVVLHESFHALAPQSEHVSEGLYGVRSLGESRIDSASLSELCAHFECEAFVPEE